MFNQLPQCGGIKSNKMYNDEKALAAKRPAQFEVVEKMGIEIIERFNPEEQNEALKIIEAMITEKRQAEIESAAKQLDFLRDSMENLIGRHKTVFQPER